MNEIELINLILGELGSAAQDSQARIGPGDDAAVMDWAKDQQLVVSTDVCLDGVHVPKNCPGDLVGYRTVAMCIADVVAMGAAPRFLSIALTIEYADIDWITAFVNGVRVGCEIAQTTVIGGNIAKGPKNIAITALGSVPNGHAIKRNTTQPDDDVWVTGTLGASVLALQNVATWVPNTLTELQRKTNTSVFARFLLPPIRTDLLDCLQRCANACTDISDGLAQELEQLVHGSSNGFRINTAEIPLWHSAKLLDVLACDDSYELLFTTAKNKRDIVMNCAQETGTTISRIGSIIGTSDRIYTPELDLAFQSPGYSHF